MQRAVVSAKGPLGARSLTSWSPLLNRGTGLLQRKCTCGGTPGPTGECEACRRRRLARERSSRDGEAAGNSGARFARDRVTYASSRNGSVASGPRSAHHFSSITVHPRLPGKSRTVTPEDKSKKPRPQQGSATIQCNGSGGYELVYGSWGGATCGTKDCVTTHESSHMADWQAKWPTGCVGQPKGYLPQGDPPDNPLMTPSQYESFLKESECKAHNADLVCAEALAKPAGCEKAVEDYTKLTRDQRSHWCGLSLGARIGLAVGGAAAGAVIGGLLGGGLGALIGAGVGALAGGIAGLLL